MTDTQALSVDTANAIYDILTENCGAKHDREGFVYHQSNGFCSEYRIGGPGGFGAKFWRNSGYLPDGTWGEMWRVNVYREDETPKITEMLAATNAELEKLRAATVGANA